MRKRVNFIFNGIKFLERKSCFLSVFFVSYIRYKNNLNIAYTQFSHYTQHTFSFARFDLEYKETLPKKEDIQYESLKRDIVRFKMTYSVCFTYDTQHPKFKRTEKQITFTSLTNFVNVNKYDDCIDCLNDNCLHILCYATTIQRIANIIALNFKFDCHCELIILIECLLPKKKTSHEHSIRNQGASWRIKAYQGCLLSYHKRGQFYTEI